MELNTVEKFLLMARHPEKARSLISDLHIHHGILGLLFLELSMKEAFTLDKKQYLALHDAAYADDPLVNEVINRIRKSRRKRKLRDWIIRLSSKASGYKWVYLQRMEEKGLVYIEKKKFLWLIPYRRVHLKAPQMRKDLLYVLKQSVMGETELTKEMVVLLGMVEACKMHKVFTRDKAELKEFKVRLKTIIKESPIAEAVEKSIQQVQAAVMAAVAASTAAAAASSAR